MRTRLIVAALALAAGAGLPGVAHAQQCSGNVPHVTGEWVTLPYQMPINPINATLLSTGRVLIVAGSENDAANNSEGSESYRAAVWEFLVDPYQVASCLPGASITGKLDASTYAGAMTIKVGPVTASYRGKLRFERLDEAAGEAELSGSAVRSLLR